MLSDEKRAALNLRLMDEVNKAHDEYVAANTLLNSLVSEIPSGVPQPDGSLRVQKAGSEVRRTLEKYTRSMKVYTDFILNGTVPSDPK